MDCPNKGRVIGGCNFEARYEFGAADLSRFSSIKTHSADDTSIIMAGLRPQTYVHDICTRCGKTVKRQ